MADRYKAIVFTGPLAGWLKAEAHAQGCSQDDVAIHALYGAMARQALPDNLKWLDYATATATEGGLMLHSGGHSIMVPWLACDGDPDVI
jgi:hypothetical protein